MATALYSASLRLALPTTGDLFGTWGTEVNNSITNMVDQAVAGRAVVNMASDANYTLTALNGTSDEARCAVLKIVSGVSLTTTRNVVCPLVPKLYIVENATTGGQAIQVIAASGTGVTIPNGRTYRIRCDGTNVITADGDFVAGLGSLTFPSYTFTGDTNTGMYSPGADQLNLVVGGTRAIRIGSTGNVGIGAAPGAAKLSMQDTTNCLVQSEGLNGYGSYAAYGSGSNPTYLFFFSGGVETARVTVTSTNVMAFAHGSGATESMRIDANRKVLVGLTSANTSGAKLQVADGVTFPAAQVVSGDNNTMDDYEKGLWTPVLYGSTSSGSGTYTTQYGRYTKVGNKVSVYAKLVWTAHSGTGNMLINGFPYPAGGTFGHRLPISVLSENIATTAGTILGAYFDPNGNNIEFVERPTGGGTLNKLAIDTAGTLEIAFTYFVY